MSNGLSTTSALDNRVLTKLVVATLDAGMRTADIKATDRRVVGDGADICVIARVLRGK
jgi:hypothetical protein